MSPDSSFRESLPGPARMARARSVRGLVLLVIVGLVSVGCSKKLDMPRLKAEIQKGVQQQSGVTVHWVECPETRKAQPGDRFECRVGIDGGTVTVDVVQDDYANAKWTQREQLLDPRAVEATIRAGLKQFAGVEAAVVCPDLRRPSVEGARFACTADPAGPAAAYQVAVLIKDARGQIDWSIPRSAVPAAGKKK